MLPTDSKNMHFLRLFTPNFYCFDIFFRGHCWRVNWRAIYKGPNVLFDHIIVILLNNQFSNIILLVWGWN